MSFCNPSTLKSLSAISFCGVFILSFFLLSPEKIFSQDIDKKNNQKTAESLSIRLKQKVLLTDQQTKQVETILLAYLNSGEKGGKNLIEAQNKIDILLDAKQKVKYQIIKGDWWNEINLVTLNP